MHASRGKDAGPFKTAHGRLMTSQTRIEKASRSAVLLVVNQGKGNTGLAPGDNT